MKSQSKRIQAQDRHVKISDIIFDINHCAHVAQVISSIDYLIKVPMNQVHCSKGPAISPEGCRMLLQQFPILVYKDNDKYMCFAGLRSFFLAQMVFHSDEKIPVRFYPNSINEPEAYAFAGLFLGEIFLLMKSAGDLGRIVNAMPARLMSEWLNGVTNKAQLARMLGISRTHFKQSTAGGEE